MTDDLDAILTAARSWLKAGHRVALATVIETWGSAPRRVGSNLVVRDDGLFVGSVSGGCVEADVITESMSAIAAANSKRLDYGVADATAWQAGLACGGRIAVFVQPIDQAHFPAELIERLAQARAVGEGVTLATDLATGVTVEGEVGAFVHHHAPPLRLAVIGAVHIAQVLVPMAHLLGYATIVVDPRGLFAATARFDGVAVDNDWPDEALARWKPNAASAVVALSHDPKFDDVALAAALRSSAFYIGALGSRRNHAARLERLAALGFDEAARARVRGPVGLDIGAATPAEIALSIAAQMTAARRGKA